MQSYADFSKCDCFVFFWTLSYLLILKRTYYNDEWWITRGLFPFNLGRTSNRWGREKHAVSSNLITDGVCQTNILCPEQDIASTGQTFMNFAASIYGSQCMNPFNKSVTFALAAPKLSMCCSSKAPKVHSVRIWSKFSPCVIHMNLTTGVFLQSEFICPKHSLVHIPVINYIKSSTNASPLHSSVNDNRSAGKWGSYL